VVPASYHDFFGGCATVAGALIGLLFVAISIFPQKLIGDKTSTDYQAKAGAAFSALTNTLVIALVALLPGASLSTAVIALAAAGLATTASLIVLLYREHMRVRLGPVILPVILLILYGLQLANGIELSSAPGDMSRLTSLGGLAIAFFLFAITRAWQLVGAWDMSLLSTVAKMSRRAPLDEQPMPSEQAGEAAPADESADLEL
jgi:hypothetical protein